MNEKCVFPRREALLALTLTLMLGCGRPAPPSQTQRAKAYVTLTDQEVSLLLTQVGAEALTDVRALAVLRMNGQDGDSFYLRVRIPSSDTEKLLAAARSQLKAGDYSPTSLGNLPPEEGIDWWGMPSSPGDVSYFERPDNPDSPSPPSVIKWAVKRGPSYTDLYAECWGGGFFITPQIEAILSRGRDVTAGWAWKRSNCWEIRTGSFDEEPDATD